MFINGQYFYSAKPWAKWQEDAVWFVGYGDREWPSNSYRLWW